MRDKRETPAAWLPLFEKRGVRSAQHLSDLSGVAVQTVVRLLHGPGEPSRATLNKVAGVLKVEPAELLKLRGQQPREAFVLPQSADRLNEKQRAAVLAVVRAMLDPADTSATDRQAGGRPDDAPVVPLKRVARKRPPQNRQT